MTRILHLSDPHLRRPPELVSGRLDTQARLRDAAARIAAQLPKIAPVDALLVTGDISEDGSPESYALFREIVAPLALPLLVLPGNHDARAPFRSAFADLGLLPDDGLLDWSRDIGALRVIGLDTLVEGQGGGEVRRSSLDHLSRALGEAAGPALVALHHPPFDSGIAFMDRIGLAGREDLADRLARHHGPVRLAAGHLHVMIAGEAAGRSVIVAPSPASTFDADFRAGAPAGFLTAPGGFMVHDWIDGGFRSMMIGPGPVDGPYPF